MTTSADFRAQQDEAISEAILHKRVAEFLDAVVAPPWFWSTIPAGGGGMIRGAQLKARGFKPGLPDLMIWGPDRALLAVELKKKGGYLSDEQKAMRDCFARCGFDWATCRSVEEVDRALSFVRRAGK